MSTDLEVLKAERAKLAFDTHEAINSDNWTLVGDLSKAALRLQQRIDRENFRLSLPEPWQERQPPAAGFRYEYGITYQEEPDNGPVWSGRDAVTAYERWKQGGVLRVLRRQVGWEELVVGEGK